MPQTSSKSSFKASKGTLSEPVFILTFALFFVLLENIAFWKTALSIAPTESPASIALIISIFIFMVCSLNILFSIFLWRPWLKPLLTLLLFISAAVSYFGVTYGVYIDHEMILNTTRSSSQEAMALITPQFLSWIAVLGLLPAIAVWKIKIKPVKSIGRTIMFRLMSIAISATVLIAAVMPLYKDYASFFRNNKEIVKLITPTNYIWASYSFIQMYIHSNQPLLQIGLDAKQIHTTPTSKPTLFILVVGETARAENFSLYGYPRNTNPLLSQQNNLLVFKNTTSCGTNTATSVPCMFSKMLRSSYSASLAEHQENLMDILQRAGINVLWKENNTGCQGVCTRIETSPIVWEIPKDKCTEDFCFDSSLLDNLDTYIAKKTNGDIFIVLHTIGSHGPSYYRRYPATLQGQFKPSCDTNQIQDCSQESLINAYDNTILNTDYLLNQTIELLKTYENKYETGMLYLSDHGESLGENGMYLHSAPYMIAPNVQTHIPMLFWSSNEFMQQRNINPTCMQQQALTHNYSQDNLFHTMLGLMSVSTAEYQPALDLFNDCKETP